MINMERKYRIKDFKNSTPEWKRKKDPLIGRLLYRPLSYLLSCILANMGVRPNTVSYFSMIVSIVGCGLFLFESHTCHIIGAIVFIFWAVLDCVDGDMARTTGKQPFGEFADAISCYMLQGLMCITMGVAVFYDGGALFNQNDVLIIIIGSFASIANCLMRLIYQKYLSCEKDHIEQGIIKKTTDVWKDKGQVSNFKVKFKEAMGVGGVLPIIILIAEIFKVLDIVVIYCFIVYGGAFVLTSLGYVKKAVSAAEKYEKEGLHQLDKTE